MTDPREPRSAAIIRATHAALRATGTTLTSFSQSVVEHYLAHVALHERSIEFHIGGDPFDTARQNCQIVTRFLNGQVRFAADIEESWVLSLPQPYQQRLLTELAHRYGLIAAPEPVTEGAQQHRRAGDLMRETGEAMIAVSGLLADGRIDASDQRMAQHALREIDDVIAAAVGLRATIEHCTGPSAPTPLRRAG